MSELIVTPHSDVRSAEERDEVSDGGLVLWVDEDQVLGKHHAHDVATVLAVDRNATVARSEHFRESLQQKNGTTKLSNECPKVG
jgi:hypothetical protein